ncbi:MAG: chromate efflux transporter [Thalassotalea sp.]|nr:chromate efflux transporter [Thalassotalea sp.]
MIEIFIKFFSLGCVSFGGPAAHIGYFQQAFVEKHKWLNATEYGRIVALSQFLPGPGSSQVGFAIGYHRAGLVGAIAAFVAFTLPSVILMLTLAFVGFQYADAITFQGVIYGLKLLAVVVVLDAILSMAKSFCQSWVNRGITLISAIALVSFSSSLIQVLVIALAALAGFILTKRMQGSNQLTKDADNHVSQELKVGESGLLANIRWLPLIIFAVLIIGSSFLAKGQNLMHWFHEFFFTGSLVFGGGHVVLPLLQETVADNLSSEAFLTGYAAAQAVPGPMFTMATFLGTQLDVSAPVITALIATVAIFLPGFLLLLAFQYAWYELSSKPSVSGAMSGINASVVGLLVAAFGTPIASSALHEWWDFAAVALGFALVRYVKVQIGIVVLCFAALGVLLFQLGYSTLVQ